MSKRTIPARNAPASDSVMTPRALAQTICKYLQPHGRILEPCAGHGAFMEPLQSYTLDDVEFFECDERRTYCRSASGDFLAYPDIKRLGRYDWVVTNPPWSKLTAFLRRSFEVADNVAFLMPIPGTFFNSRLRAARAAGFGIRRILEVPWPRVWTSENKIVKPGYAIGAVHWERGYSGPLVYDVLAQAQVLEAVAL